MLDRREFLIAGGACAASCRSVGHRESGVLDTLLATHAEALPEGVGTGANHYPMAAEALAALGHGDAIDPSWIDGVKGYAGELPRASPLRDIDAALGDYGRYGDWWDHFRKLLRNEPWSKVVGRWSSILAPGISAAAFHGVIRTGHAVRALEHHDNAARRGELACGLAYWAARYAELPIADPALPTPRPFSGTLAKLSHPWLEETDPVDFFSVGERMARAPIAPPIPSFRRSPSEDDRPTLAKNQAQLAVIVEEASRAFLEMLVQQRYRIWLLHTVTGPASTALILPHAGPEEGRRLVEYVRQAVVCMFIAYGAPFTPLEHVRPSPAPWGRLVPRAVTTQSVHTIKLIEALHRFDPGRDTLYRSVAEQWLEWT